MAKIQTSSELNLVSSGVPLRGSLIADVAEEVSAANTIKATTAASTPSKEEIITPGTYFFKNLEGGDDLLISADSGSSFPFRVKPKSAQTFRLDIESLLETSTVQTVADLGGSLGGTYFDLTDNDGTVRTWLDVAARAEISTIQTVADSSDSLDGTYVIIYDAAGSVGVWFDVNDNGTTVPAGAAAADRQIEVTGVSTNDTAITVASVLKNALDADGAFSATFSSSTVTVTDAATGARTDIADGDTGFTVAVSQQGLDASSAPSAPAGGRLVEASISADADAPTVAAAIDTAFSGDTGISSSVSSDTVTLTDKHAGTRADITDTGSTGFTLATTQQGSAAPTVQIKSVGTSTVLYGIAPF